MTTKTKKLSVPREMADIQKDYQQHCFNAGQIQYQLTVLESELKQVNERIRSLNNEGAARKQLDAQKPTEEVSNEQNSGK